MAFSPTCWLRAALQVDGAGEVFARRHHHATAVGAQAGVGGVSLAVAHGAAFGDIEVTLGKPRRLNALQDAGHPVPRTGGRRAVASGGCEGVEEAATIAGGHMNV
ncbi:MAG: hypothetical protein KJZ78_05140 [Bryobacteraceae bacterium]|nr:hypothetical protein [Bryobacteraceae bacterium]